MTELTSSCIATVSENCFTSVLHGAWHLWTGIPAQDDCTTHYSYSAFLGFASETSILMSPHNPPRGLGWPLHSINLVGLEPRWCSLTGVFGVIVLLKHPFQGHFLFSISQHDLFKYFKVLKLIHDSCNVIKRPNTVVWETSPYHDACAISQISQYTVAWIQCLGVIWQTACGP